MREPQLKKEGVSSQGWWKCTIRAHVVPILYGLVRNGISELHLNL